MNFVTLLRGAVRAVCAVLIVVGAGVPCHDAMAREVRGINFADKVKVEDTGSVLSLQGATSVDRSFLPFQLLVLYTDSKHNSLAELQSAQAPFRMVIHWLVAPEFPAAEAGKYWTGRFDQLKLDPTQKDSMKSSFARLATAIGGGARDSQTVIDYDPEQGIRVRRPGSEVARFAGVDLSRALIALWLGVDNEQRRDLLGASKPDEGEKN
jgi:hypothetical protein